MIGVFFIDRGDGMKLEIEKMSESDVMKIFFWKYTPPYDWYNLEESEESVNSFIQDNYVVAKDKTNRMIGFFCYGASAQVSAGAKFGFYNDSSYLDIGLGLNPILCGRGYGAEFLELGMQYGRKVYGAQKYRLTVADFNERAIRVYQKVGFKEEGFFEARNQIEKVRFIVMYYE